MNFTCHFFLRMVEMVVVNLADTLGQVRIPQLKSFSPGLKLSWIHFLILSSILLNNYKLPPQPDYKFLGDSKPTLSSYIPYSPT